MCSLPGVETSSMSVVDEANRSANSLIPMIPVTFVHLKATSVHRRSRVTSRLRSRHKRKGILKESTHNASINGMQRKISSTTSFTLLATICPLKRSSPKSAMKSTFTSKGRLSHYLHLKSWDMIQMDMDIRHCETPARLPYNQLWTYTTTLSSLPHRFYRRIKSLNLGDKLVLAILPNPSIRYTGTSLQFLIQLTCLNQSLKNCVKGSPGCRLTHNCRQLPHRVWTLSPRIGNTLYLSLLNV